jgi:transcriptional repressor NrdR
MLCPDCHRELKVLETRTDSDGKAVRRRRACSDCGQRYFTIERLESIPAVVTKRSGLREPFDREKIGKSVRMAAPGRKSQISDAALEKLMDDVIKRLSGQGPVVSSAAIGGAVLECLKPLDQVAFVQFGMLFHDLGGDAAECLRWIEQEGISISMSHMPVLIEKRDGRRQPYDRAKLEKGILLASGSRLSADKVQVVVQTVEDKLLKGAFKLVTTQQIAEAVVAALRSVDLVTYLRYNFDVNHSATVTEVIAPIAEELGLTGAGNGRNG